MENPELEHIQIPPGDSDKRGPTFELLSHIAFSHQKINMEITLIVLQSSYQP